jgi:hypothetical protein
MRAKGRSVGPGKCQPGGGLYASIEPKGLAQARQAIRLEVPGWGRIYRVPMEAPAFGPLIAWNDDRPHHIRSEGVPPMPISA